MVLDELSLSLCGQLGLCCIFTLWGYNCGSFVITFLVLCTLWLCRKEKESRAFVGWSSVGLGCGGGMTREIVWLYGAFGLTCVNVSGHQTHSWKHVSCDKDKVLISLPADVTVIPKKHTDQQLKP